LGTLRHYRHYLKANGQVVFIGLSPLNPSDLALG
jgi:hypothetical protein